MTISNDSRARIKRIFEPIALGFGRLGLTPDGLTVIGFGITVVGAILLGAQLWLIGGLVVFIGGVFDMFDGTLARATNQVSKLGAFMDSVFDRFGEAVVYVGLIAGLQAAGWGAAVVLAGAAMAAAFMVSYTRAKSEGLGFTAGTGMAAIGVMPREVRLIILSLGLILAGILGSATSTGGIVIGGVQTPTGIAVLELALAIIAIGATITVFQRILHVRSQAKSSTTSK